MAGSMIVPSIVDPYTMWERFCLACIRPLAGCFAASRGSDGSGIRPLSAALTIAMSSAAGAVHGRQTSLGLVAVVAARRGRTFCNTICPVVQLWA